MNKINELILLDMVKEEMREIYLTCTQRFKGFEIIQELFENFDHILEFPQLGKLCEDRELAELGYRKIIHKEHQCFYRSVENQIIVYHILNEKMNISFKLRNLK